ncbi:hypothetical protein N7453_007808 [Penicillium expansum]|nr:hypothetical protein N7453_007808 [Penicillium expansum]
MRFCGWLSRLRRKERDSRSTFRPDNDSLPAFPSTTPARAPAKASTITERAGGKTQEAKADSAASVSEAEVGTEPIPESQQIWEEAYELVKNDESLKSIVDEYEAAILSELWPMSAVHDGPRAGETNTSLIGGIANLKSSNRQDLMTRLINKDGASSDRYKTVSQISTIIDSTKKTIGSVLDVYPPASLAWAGVCLVLTPVFNHARATQENQNGLVYIVSKLPWYIHLIDLLRSDAWSAPEKYQKFKIPIRKEIVGLYQLVIAYQIRTFGAYHHKFRDFAKSAVGLTEWESMLQEMKSSEQRVDKFVSHENMTQVLVGLKELKKQSESNANSLIAAWKEQQSSIEEKKQLKKLIQDFKPNPSQHDYKAYGDYLDKIPSPLEGTNNEVRNHPQFKRWESGQDRLLLLVASPGMGKSVFTKSLRDEMSNSKAQEGTPEKPTICSFFFKDKSGQQNQPTIALCKILYDLFLVRPELVPDVQEMVKSLDKDDVRFNIDKLWDVFQVATQNAARGSIIVFFDALDEVDLEQRKRFLERLQKFSSQSVKILLTTRPIKPVLEIFQQKQFTLDLNDDPTCNQTLCDNITKVAESRLHKFCQSKSISQEPVKEKLRNHLNQYIDGSRTYLFVQLLFDYLDKQPVERLQSTWIKKFKTMPTTVSDTYRALLDNIQTKDQSSVKTMLQIVLAAQRPLTVREMNIALNVSEVDIIHSIDDMELMPVDAFKAWILETCHFFLVTYDDRIHFIHQTVRDYLLPGSNEDRRPQWLGQGFGEHNCHQIAMKSCLRYISAPFIQNFGELSNLEQFFNAPLYTQGECQQWFMDQNGFYEYAFTQWLVHLDFIRKHEKRGWRDILEAIKKQYDFMSFDLAEFVFCCSSFPSKTEVEVFRSMPSMGSSESKDLALGCLTQGLITRYLTTSIFSELSYAIEIAEDVIKSTDTNDQRLGRRLVDLSRAYMHQLEGDTGDSILAALKSADRAIQVTSPGHIDRSRALAARASALGNRFYETSQSADISQAIDCLKDALDPTSYSLTEQDRLQFLHNLAVFYGYRNQGSDLEEAITAAQQSLNGTSPHNPRRHNALHTLSVWLLARARRTREEKHIQKAIDISREALHCAPPMGADRFMVLRDLARALQLRYSCNSSKKDLEEALEFAEQALSSIPEYHARYSDLLGLHEELKEEIDDLQDEVVEQLSD